MIIRYSQSLIVIIWFSYSILYIFNAYIMFIFANPLLTLCACTQYIYNLIFGNVPEASIRFSYMVPSKFDKCVHLSVIIIMFFRGDSIQLTYNIFNSRFWRRFLYIESLLKKLFNFNE